MRNRVSPPQIVADNCLVYSTVTEDGLTVRVFKWCGTDYVDVCWLKKPKKAGSLKAIGMIEMFYLQKYGAFRELIADIPRLTEEMRSREWGYRDDRDFTVRRVFGAENLFV